MALVESEEPEDPFPLNRFPLRSDEIESVIRVSELVREHLPDMKPAELRSAALLLLALERLPTTTSGVDLTVGFVQPNTDGNFGWADIQISEREFRLVIGEHFYEPSVGGDTQTRVAFEAFAGAESVEGNIDEWLPVARVIMRDGQVEVEDQSDYTATEWATETEEVVEVPDGNTNALPPPNKQTVSREDLLRIFNEASVPMSSHIREQLAYRHMIALADTFEGWALDKQLIPQQSVRLIGMSESMRSLADEVGQSWDPPTPEPLTLMGFLGRIVLDEITPERT